MKILIKHLKSRGVTLKKYRVMLSGDNTRAYFFIFNMSGSVGIGTLSPGEKLEVTGNILASGTITQNSDIRLKTNIEPIDNSLEKIIALRGVTYDWKDPLRDTGRKQIGVIAQDVEQVFPEAVRTGHDGIKSVAYSQLIAPVIEAIKVLYGKFTEDRQAKELEIAALKSENEILRSDVSSLKGWACTQEHRPDFCN